MCRWVSTMPGMMIPPAAFISNVPSGTERFWPIASMFSPTMSTSVLASTRRRLSTVTTVPLRNTIGWPSRGSSVLLARSCIVLGSFVETGWCRAVSGIRARDMPVGVLCRRIPAFGRGYIHGVPVYREVDVRADGRDSLFGDVTDESRRAREKGESAKQLYGEPEISQRRARDAGTVERQLLAEHLLLHSADRFEQFEVGATGALLLGNANDHRGAGIAVLVDGMAQARDAGVALPGLAERNSCSLVPLQVGPRLVAVGEARDDVVEIPSGVFRHTQKARAAAQQAGRDRSLEGVGRAVVGQPRCDRCRGEPMVGQRDEHRFEYPHLVRGGAAPGDQPESKLPERHVPQQLPREIVTKQ